MDKRRDELMKLKSYNEEIDNELTMILQTLQWDRKHLLQNPVMATCRYDSNHKVPPDKTEEHEKECFLRKNGYSKDDQLLPDPLDSESNTLVKLKKEDIEQIIANASRSDLLFKKVYRKIVQGSESPHSFRIQGVGCRGAEPLSLERLQTSYSADERRAIHDAVVSAVPSCHDLTDLALLSGGDNKNSKIILSRMEILLELRNMRRRRTKYRVAAKSRNYSDVLRDVIKTQMEHYNEGKIETDPKEIAHRYNNQRDTHNDSRHSRVASHSRYDEKIVPRPIVKIEIKTEREDSTERNRDYSKEEQNRAYRYEMGSKETDRHGHRDRFRERKNDEDIERIQKYGEHSRKRRYDNETRERRNYYKESKERRTDSDPGKEYRSEKRSKRCHRHKEYSEYQVKKEPGLDEETSNHHKEAYRERRHGENRNKSHKHKDRTTERIHDDKRRRDRERSRERRQDHRYEEIPNERIHIKEEREGSVTRNDRSNYEKEKADRSIHRRYDRDRNYDNDSYSSETKQEKYERYYDRPSEEIYDPNKKIKVEK